MHGFGARFGCWQPVLNCYRGGTALPEQPVRAQRSSLSRLPGIYLEPGFAPRVPALQRTAGAPGCAAAALCASLQLPACKTGRKEHLPQSRRCRRPGAQSARRCRKCLESKTRSPTGEFLQPARRRESPPLLSCGFPEPPGTAARFHHPKSPEFLRGRQPPTSPIPLSPAELPAAPKDQTAASSSSLSSKIQAPHTNPFISAAPEPDLK